MEKWQKSERREKKNTSESGADIMDRNNKVWLELYGDVLQFGECLAKLHNKQQQLQHGANGAQRSLQQGCVMAKRATDLYAVGGPHFKNLLTVGTTTVKEMPVGSMGQ